MSNIGQKIAFDVFGRRVLVKRTDRAWSVFYLSDDGKRRAADNLRIPSHLGEQELEQYLADICHEWATARHPNVQRLD